MKLTIEELETIAICVSNYATEMPEDYMPLYDKICFLINNYCEHNWVPAGQSLFLDVFCTKCHKIIGEVLE